MNKREKDIALLDECIEVKWTYLISHPLVDELDCVLCEKYVRMVGRTCLGCPVMQFSGSPWCKDTPFEEWVEVRWDVMNDRGEYNKDDLINAAKDERAFLIKVRDKLIRPYD